MICCWGDSLVSSLWQKTQVRFFNAKYCPKFVLRLQAWISSYRRDIHTSRASWHTRLAWIPAMHWALSRHNWYRRAMRILAWTRVRTLLCDNTCASGGLHNALFLLNVASVRHIRWNIIAETTRMSLGSLRMCFKSSSLHLLTPTTHAQKQG